jgi:hypothetical protein
MIRMKMIPALGVVLELAVDVERKRVQEVSSRM